MAVRQAGGVVELRGEGLVLRAAAPLSDELVSAVRGHREALLRMLCLKTTEPCRVCGRSSWWQRADGERVCGVCHPDPRALLAMRRAS